MFTCAVLTTPLRRPVSAALTVLPLASLQLSRPSPSAAAQPAEQREKARLALCEPWHERTRRDRIGRRGAPGDAGADACGQRNPQRQRDAPTAETGRQERKAREAIEWTPPRSRAAEEASEEKAAGPPGRPAGAHAPCVVPTAMAGCHDAHGTVATLVLFHARCSRDS